MVRRAIDIKGINISALPSHIGLSRSTIHNFLQGKPVEARTVISICKEFDLDWKEVIESPQENIAALQGIDEDPSLLAPELVAQIPLPISQGLGRFVGREHVFTAFDEFQEKNPRGFFSLIGDPGEGKSTIAARFIFRYQFKNKHPLFFFIQYGIQRNTPEIFHRDLCQQLLQRFPKLKEKYKSVPLDCGKLNGSFLSQLLSDPELSVSKDEPLYILVDALDEVDDRTVGNGNLLYLPDTLPNHVYFFLTRRRRFERVLNFKDHNEFYDLLEHTAECREDVAKYVDNYWNDETKNTNIRSWVAEQKLDKAGFINLLAGKKGIKDDKGKSENNFMYLFFLLNDMAEGIYRNISLAGIPSGLIGYYHQHWVRMGMQATPIPFHKINILSRLTEVKEPVSAVLLNEFSSFGTGRYVSPTEVVIVLEDWRQFLHITKKDETDYYFPYHLSFYEFLHDDPIIQETRKQLQAYRRDTTMSDAMLDGRRRKSHG